MQPLTPPPPAHVLRRPTPPAAASTMPPPPPPPSASCNRAAPPPLRPPPELPLPSALVPPKKRRVFRTPPKATTPLPPPPPPAPVPVAVAVPAPTPPPPQADHAESPLFSAQKPPPPHSENLSSPPPPPPPPPAEESPSPPPPPFAEEPSSPPPLTLPLPPPTENPNSPPPPPAGNPNSPPPPPAETPSSSFPPLPPPSAADEKPSAPPLTDPAEEPAPAPKTRKVTRTVRRRVRKGTIAARKAAADAASAAAAAGASQPGKGHAPDNSSRNAAAADELVQKEQSIGGNTIEKPASSCNPVAVCETQLGKETVAGGTLTDKPATDIGGEHEMEKKLGSRGEDRAEVGMSERQRRRMTEVFVGGLNRDAKEEDVRAALSVAGEITEVRMIMEGKTKKNKGYCFVRYREAAQARKAIARFGNVKICGKQCRVAALGGNDKIFLGNIDRKWKKEDIVKLLQKIGVENIDVVTLLPDSNNPGHNRGFAFLELETYRDAQIAYRKLSRKDVFGKGLNIRVDWAEPLNDPDENQMQKVKAVFVDGVPNSWDQAKLTEIFKKYGKVELVALSRDMRRAKRNDFALVHFYTHEAAILCLESFDGEQLTENGSKIDIRVSLAKPVQKGKNNMDNHKFCISQKDETKTAKSEKKLGPSSLHILSSYSRAVPISGYKKSSTTHGFVQVLRELAPWRHGHTGSGSLTQNYPRILSGEKRPFSALGIDSYSMNHSLDGQHERNTYATSTSSYSVSPPAITQCSPPYHHESRRCVLDSDSDSVLAEPWGGNQMRQASSRKPEGCDMTAGTNRDGLSLTDCSLR